MSVYVNRRSVGVAARGPVYAVHTQPGCPSPLDSYVQVAVTEVISSKRDNLRAHTDMSQAWQMAGEEGWEGKEEKGRGTDEVKWIGGRRESATIGNTSVLWSVKRRNARLTRLTGLTEGEVRTISRQANPGEEAMGGLWDLVWPISRLTVIDYRLQISAAQYQTCHRRLPAGACRHWGSANCGAHTGARSAESDMSPALRLQYYLQVLWKSLEHSWIADRSCSLILCVLGQKTSNPDAIHLSTLRWQKKKAILWNW